MKITSSNRLGLLKDRHSGRAVIVANGPSLSRMNLSFLKHEYVIGLNKIFLGFKKFGFYPRYYVATNAKVVEQSALEIKKLNCVKFLSDHGANGLIDEDALTYRLHTEQSRIVERFSRDIRQGVHEGWTVTYVALQVAYFLGLTEVIIIGLDHHYEYSGNPNEEAVLNGPDLNHFSTDYFGNGQTWDNPDLKNSEESYRIARGVYEQDGRKIIDATYNGACDVFEKQDYRSIFTVVDGG